MDIGGLSMAASQANTMALASMSVLKMQMDTNEVMSNNLNDMMESMAIDPSKGGNIDAIV